MSRRSEAKKARRRKRTRARDLRRRVGEILDDLLSVAGIDEALTDRGWEFDVDNSTDEVATWYFADSAVDPDGPALPDTAEPVTRIWVAALDEDVEDRDIDWHVIFVGGDAEGVDYVFSPEALLENLAVIEDYRYGDPAPDFDADA